MVDENVPRLELAYTPLEPKCDLSLASLQYAATILFHLGAAPAIGYTLTVAPAAGVYARCLLKRIGAVTPDNPFAPYISLELSKWVGRDEWILCASGVRVGSKGGV